MKSEEAEKSKSEIIYEYNKKTKILEIKKNTFEKAIQKGQEDLIREILKNYEFPLISSRSELKFPKFFQRITWVLLLIILLIITVYLFIKKPYLLYLLFLFIPLLFTNFFFWVYFSKKLNKKLKDKTIAWKYTKDVNQFLFTYYSKFLLNFQQELKKVDLASSFGFRIIEKGDNIEEADLDYSENGVNKRSSREKIFYISFRKIEDDSEEKVSKEAGNLIDSGRISSNTNLVSRNKMRLTTNSNIQEKKSPDYMFDFAERDIEELKNDGFQSERLDIRKRHFNNNFHQRKEKKRKTLKEEARKSRRSMHEMSIKNSSYRNYAKKKFTVFESELKICNGDGEKVPLDYDEFETHRYLVN